MNTISAIRSAVDSASTVGRVSVLSDRAASLAVRDTLESIGFRFTMRAGRLLASHVGRLNSMPTPADMRIVRQHSAAIRFSFAG